MDRRDFLKTVAITGAALTIQHSEAMEVLTQTINKANGSHVPPRHKRTGWDEAIR